MRARGRPLALALAATLLLTAAARTTSAQTTAADTLTPPPGALTPPPARAATLTTTALLDAAPGLFRHDLGTPGAADGLSPFGLAPHRTALTLEGRPADDLFTGRAALERLAADVLGPLRRAADPLGPAFGLATETRAFAAAVPLTELRYRAGPDGLQLVGVTHAQTRRPAALARRFGEEARLTVLAHVGAHQAEGEYANAGVTGWHLVARAELRTPHVRLAVTDRFTRRTHGAWGGVDPAAPDPFARTAPVRLPSGAREEAENELAVSLETRPSGRAAPLRATLAWRAAELRYTALGEPTSARAHRYALHARQRLPLGAWTPTLALDAWLARRTGGDGLGAEAFPPEAALALADTLEAGAVVRLALRAGGRARPGEVHPLAEAELRAGTDRLAAWTGAATGAPRLAPVERAGFAGHARAEPARTERLHRAWAGAEARAGILHFRAEGALALQQDPRVLLVEADTLARFVSVPGTFRHAGGALALGVRADARRGAYAEAALHAHALLNAAASPEHAREAAATPDLWGHLRLGVRAVALFDGALDLDVYARVRGWTAFRGRAFHAPTGLFGLAAADAPDVPARAVVDAVLEAGLGGGRARAFVAVENAGAGLLYPGVYVVPLYPLPRPALRGGLFWVLPD